MTATLNPALNRAAQQLRYWVPFGLRPLRRPVSSTLGTVQIMTMRRIVRIASCGLAFLTATPVLAVDLDHECRPSSVIAIAKEAWDPKEFWTRQLKEIQQYVEGQRLAYQMNLIDRRRAKVNETLDAEEMRALGVPQYSDPQLEKQLRETDQYIARLDLQMLREANAWGQKCTAYANQRLSNIK